MKIDTVNITMTYGLKVESMTGYESLPARKKILNEPAFTENDIVFSESNVSVLLFGKFASTALMVSKIEGLKDLIKASAVHAFERLATGVTFNGVVKKGMKIEADPTDNFATVKFEITITT